MNIRRWIASVAVCAAACVQTVPQEALPLYTSDGQRTIWPEAPTPETAFEHDVVSRIEQIKADPNGDVRERNAWQLAHLISRERIKDCSRPIGPAVSHAFYEYETYRNPNNAFERLRRDDLEPSMVLAAALLGDGNSWTVAQSELYFPRSDPPRGNARFSLTEAACIAYEAGSGKPMDWFSSHCGPRDRAERLRREAGKALQFCRDTALGRWRDGRRSVTDVILDVLAAYDAMDSGQTQAGIAYARWGADGVRVQTVTDLSAAADISIARWFDCDQPVAPEAVDRLIARMRLKPNDQFVPFALAALGPHARNAVPVLIENLDNVPPPSSFLSGPGPYDVEGQCAALEAITQRPAAESSRRCDGYRKLPGFDGSDPEMIPGVGWVCPDARLTHLSGR